jgi:hypothetical protein
MIDGDFICREPQGRWRPILNASADVDADKPWRIRDAIGDVAAGYRVKEIRW